MGTVPAAGPRLQFCADPGEFLAAAGAYLAADRLAPRVPVTDPGRYRADPRAVLIDGSAAATTLGWRAAHRWSPHGNNGHSQP